jgi:kynurenine formamidase
VTVPDAPRVLRAVDLSIAIDADTQVYPGDPHVRFRTAATIDDVGFNLLHVEMGSQSGTNCDAPYHFLESGTRIDEVDLALFAGPAVVIDVRHRAARTAITQADVAGYLPLLGPGRLALFWTDWGRYYRTDAYFDHPYLGEQACRLLLEAGVRTFCLDVLNIDETPDAAHPGVGFPCHLLIAAAGGVVVENLTGLDRIEFPNPFVTLFPLPLTGADGSPTRAVALQLEVPSMAPPAKAQP